MVKPLRLTLSRSVLLFAAAGFLSASPATAQDKSVCLACHGEQGVTMSKRGKTISLHVDPSMFGKSAHADLECVECHEGLSATDLPHAGRIKRVNCTGCHSDAKFQKYSESVHGTSAGGGPRIACSGCHTTHAVTNLSAESPEQRKQFATAVCGVCHAAVDSTFKRSDHGKGLMAGVKGAPTCIDCHDEHNVRSTTDTTAQTSRKNLAQMCLRCHIDNNDVRDKVGPSAKFISSYEKSIHARGVQNGNDAAATCIDCHGSHEMRKGSNPESRVARKNIAGTCGACHGDVFEQYTRSIHGTSLAKGVTASATCTDCHGEHNILSPKDASSRVSANNVSLQVCTPCHGSVLLTQKYGLASDRFTTFADSYHGLAGTAGSVQVANCASCHGVHDIMPSSDSTSRISKKNLARTCGSCHPGANENFSKGSVHILAESGKSDLLYYLSTGYILMIIMVVGGMALHNILDFVKKSKRQLLFRRGVIRRTHPDHRLYLRMSLSERMQHGSLLISFFTLVLTGFALKYPDAWWVAPVRNFSPIMFEARGILHRAAGVVMVLASFYHAYYLFFVPRGKQLLRDLLPVRKDLADAVGVLKYNLGFSKDKPLFGRFSYIEKSEYWALIWGTAVMAVTGAILWFDNTFLGLLTKLWWDVAQTVHYYEAWLATLSIIVWHFYFVIFNPDVYPVNLAFWKGTLTEEEMAEEHPLELEVLKRAKGHDEEPGR
jgi:cytochrome b subunit of formate dehydrogenase/nitrate/TMAO reductase-like tetraheme cytochrome c subunit